MKDKMIHASTEPPFDMLDCAEEILPAFSGTEVPIVLASSDYFLPYCAVTIQSILDHSSKDNNYDIFILTTGINADHQQYLKQMISGRDNVSVRLVSMLGAIDQYQLFEYPHISRETYFRMTVPWVFSNFSRVIFVDSDMVVCGDLAECNDIVLTNYYLAAAPDIVMAGFVNGYNVFLRITYRQN